MDPHYPSQYEAFVPAQSYTRDATTIEQRDRHVDPVPRQPSTSPLPSRQWANNTARPREFRAFRANNPIESDAASLQRTQSSGAGFRMTAPASRIDASRPKRRPRPLDQERLSQPLDSTMLYPQLSPYDDLNEGFGHATFDYYPRSVSQPVTPGFVQPSSQGPTPVRTNLPSWEPVSERTRGDNSDAAFNDEHEFRLFVEATAGLGPISSLDRRDSSPEVSRNPFQDTNTDFPPHISPTAETPTTLRALQHLAQMPQSTLPPQSAQPHLQSFGSNFDNWLQAPPARPRLYQQHSMPQMSAPAPLNHWQDVLDGLPIEDELPDYAASQAQAQAAQRVEATRRAQELQRRWQESGSNVIRYA